MFILGIESSCDETAIAVVENGRNVITSKILSQISKHQGWGGVIPEYASRLHLESINDLIKEIFSGASISIDDIDAVAVTQGPGLMGSLMVGVNTAKIFSWVHNKKIIPVNHLHAHVCASFLGTDLEPPFLCMLASGGHTQIIQVKSYTSIEVLGETIDDAAGEAFDKVARLMDLPYPGGPAIDLLASTVDDLTVSSLTESNSIVNGKYKFTIAKVADLDFSFSGLKTAVLRLKQKIGSEFWEKDKAKIASAFQECVAQTFYQKISLAISLTGIKTIVLVGGVAANSVIRKVFQEKFSQEHGYQLFLTDLNYCTDNAAMVAAAAYYQLGANSNQSFRDYAFEPFSR